MTSLFPDFFRAIVTDIMLILLLSVMATPKYKSKSVYVFATAIVLAANIGVNYYFYRTENYTAVFYVDLVMLLVIGVALKPLFTDKVMQWCFNYITILNIYIAVVFLSYIWADVFPRPMYGNSYVRLILFSMIIVVFRKQVSKLYRTVLDYWHIYILPAVSLFACFLSYLFGGDIRDRLSENYIPLMLLILLGLSVYISIIHSLKTITKQYAMREENQKMQAEREYLQLAAGNMSRRLELMEEVSAQNSRAAHDRRHFNNVLLELLEQEKIGEATALLQSQNQMTQKISRVYCENPAVNAAVCHYAALAEQAGISTETQLDIPRELTVDSLEFSMVVSNLLENAIQACGRITDGTRLYLRFTCKGVGRLLLEMENPCGSDTSLDGNGYPLAGQEDHGIGSKSVIAFAKKYDGELIYNIENGVFRVRLLV
ncbi:GHKL domain-containing protein [Lacrimispora amygdalina]|uniref:GHKL domain-containing protein n=1 Tax=Lacrimispora amygdalina TaxID=253257 RepID=A0A3E2N8R3_9FIRM|nr:GHKL domain-containing protein [Clostridium indicum]RFZ77386.1 GHKL domain-containing protein [Clostridium indicum]